MPRLQKKRYVCCMPKNNCFAPVDNSSEDTVVMTLDEYEAIRLIDLEKYTQEDCAVQMHIARTTVQGVYNKARGKIADALVNSKKLVIAGGNYILCKRYGNNCGRGCKRHCHKHQCDKTNLEEHK
ncbi:MAG TPA: DUF134 domain-containing protein [Clostridiales bacterium]|nr:DUF134 domain-containing protein [Clostridiales bacterium]